MKDFLETNNVEYKRSWRDEWLKWICAFANAQGGKLYVGIDEKSRKVVGVDNPQRLLVTLKPLVVDCSVVMPRNATTDVEQVKDAESANGRSSGDQVTDQVADQVMTMLPSFGSDWRTASELRQIVGISHAQTFRKNHLHPAMKAGLVEMRDTASVRSPMQKYRLTANGQKLLDALNRNS